MTNNCGNGQIVHKLKTQWTKDEKHASNCNNKVMNEIYNGVSAEEFRRISTLKLQKKHGKSYRQCMRV